MAITKENFDINEAFENLLFGEEIAENCGYKEGYNIGKGQLQLDTYHLGYHRASILAAQLGYYSGVLEQCLKVNSFSEKAIKLAETLQEDISSFPRINDDITDILKAFDDIKFKYTRFCSLAKISFLYPEDNKLDF